MTSRPSVRDLLRSLSAQGLFEETKTETASLHLAHAQAHRPMPVYLQALVGAGAWAAAICFLAFLGISGIVNEKTLWPAGLVLTAFAIALHRWSRHVFVAQTALALVLAGQAMAVGGIGETSNSFAAATAAAAVLAAALYPLYPDPLQRFLSTGIAIGLATGLVVERDLPHALHALVGAEAAAALWLWTRPRLAGNLRPLAYSVAVAVPGTLALLLADFEFGTPAWPSSILMAGAMAWAVAWAARGSINSEPVRLALAGAVLLAATFAPGLPAGVALLVLGYARRERGLAALGIASFAGALVMLYYDLGVDLGTKSALLGLSGLLLLVVREVLRRRPWARKEAA